MSKLFNRLFIMIFSLLLEVSSFAFCETSPKKDEYFLLVTGCAASGTTYISKLLRESGLEIGHENFLKDGISSWYMAVDSENKPPYGPSSKGLYFKHVFHQVRNPLDVISSLYFNANKRIDNSSWNYICKNSSIDHSNSWYSQNEQNQQGGTWGNFYYDKFNKHEHFRLDNHRFKNNSKNKALENKDGNKNLENAELNNCLLAGWAKYWYYWNLEAEKKAEWRYRIEDIDLVFDEMQERLGTPLKKESLLKISKKTHTRKPITQKITWSDLKIALSDEDFSNIQNLALKYGYPTQDKEKN